MARKKMIAGAITVIVLIGIIIYALTNSSSAPTPSPSKPNAGQQTTQSKPPTPAPAPSTPNTSPTNGSLTDTGPGDVVGVFLAVSAAGYLISLRLRLRAN